MTEVLDSPEVEESTRASNIVKGKRGAQATAPPTAVATETPKSAVIYSNMDDLTRIANMHNEIDLSEMPETFDASGATKIPCIDDTKTRIRRLDNGKEIEVPIDIAYENSKKYNYAWLSADDLQSPSFRGYIAVTKTNEGSRNLQGKRLPDHAFGGQQFIRVGSAMLCFCKIGYAKSHKADGQNKALNKLAKYAKDAVSDQVRNDEGEVMGSIVSAFNEVTGFEEE